MSKTRIQKLESLEGVVRAALRELGEKDAIRCGFCHRDESEIERMVASGLVYICNECIEICVDVLKDSLEKTGKVDWTKTVKDVGKLIKQKMEEIGKVD